MTTKSTETKPRTTRARKTAAAPVVAAKPEAQLVARFSTDPFAERVADQITPVVENVVSAINDVANSDLVQITASRVTPKIPAKTREIIYNIGIWVGFAGTVAAPLAALLTGDAQIAVGAVAPLALALTNLLSKLNLSKTADDLAKEQKVANG